MSLPCPKTREKGSQWQLQMLVNNTPDLLNSEIRNVIDPTSNHGIYWVSPLKNDHDYKEYRDQEFIDVLYLQERVQTWPLVKFWPDKGPCWDALGYSDSGEIFLIEAKSHVNEMYNPSAKCKAGAKSRQRISASLARTRAHFKSDAKTEMEVNQWMEGYYQYANRLAHLYWLRKLNAVNAYLIFIYFINDPYKPTNRDSWDKAIREAHDTLRLSAGTLKASSVHTLFLPAKPYDA